MRNRNEPKEAYTAYPLTWPERSKRTDPNRREHSRFRAVMGKSRDLLMLEIRRLGGKDVVLSTNIPVRQDGLPYAGAKEPTDSGVAVYFNYNDRPMCFACDRYMYVRENLYAIALTIKALRAIDRWGASDMMERAFTGFLALPEHASQPWRDVLGISADVNATPDLVKEQFRKLAKQYAPDMPGGDRGKFEELMEAIKTARTELGV